MGFKGKGGELPVGLVDLVDWVRDSPRHSF